MATTIEREERTTTTPDGQYTPNQVLATGSYDVIGTRPIRHDGVDKVTGRALYGADVQMAGLLHGLILRSPHAHARIRSIDISKAAALPGVGAVGAKLLYPDGTVQHGGVAVGLHGAAGHLHQFLPCDSPGYMNRLQVPHNVSAVTGACLLMPRTVFERVGGFDEEFALAYNDVDLCLKAVRAGYRSVWTPDAVLVHHESKTRGEDDTPAKRRRLLLEVDRLRAKWAEVFRDGDPYFGPHFRLDRTDFCLK